MISDGDHNFKQSIWKKRVKYRNVWPYQKNVNMGSSVIQQHTEIHFDFVDMIDMQIQNWLKKRIFICFKTNKYGIIFSWNIKMFKYMV